MDRNFAQLNADLLKRFSQRLNHHLDEAGYPRQYAGRLTQLADSYEVSVQTARKWTRGTGMPSPATLLTMASDFKTTVDYLLGSDRHPGIPPDVFIKPIPLFRLPPFADDSRHTQFSRSDTIYSSGWPFIPLPDQNEIVLLLSWADSADPPIKRGDVLLVNINGQAITEEGVYVVRTATMTSIRRANVSLSNTVHFSKIDAGFQRDESDVPLDQVEFNSERDFLAAARPGKLLIVGRVVGYYRRLETREAGLS